MMKKIYQLFLILLYVQNSQAASKSSHVDEIFTKKQAKAACDIIFRNVPEAELKKLKIEFKDTYPQITALKEPAGYDRGYSKGHQEQIFMQALDYVARAADINVNAPIVWDLGCGLAETTTLFALTGAEVVGFDIAIAEEEEISIKERIASAKNLWESLSSYNLEKIKQLNKSVSDLKFFCGVKTGRDLTNWQNPVYQKTKDFDRPPNIVFAGNFFHMFSPGKGRFIIESLLEAKMKKDGRVFASVTGYSRKDRKNQAKDGVNLFTEQQVYEQSLRMGLPFPSVRMNTLLISEDRREPLSDLFDTYPYGLIDSNGKISGEDILRQQQEMQIVVANKIPAGKGYKTTGGKIDTTQPLVDYPEIPAGTILKGIKAITTFICDHDESSIDFMFPETKWDLRKKFVLHSWFIEAIKK